MRVFVCLFVIMNFLMFVCDFFYHCLLECICNFDRLFNCAFVYVHVCVRPCYLLLLLFCLLKGHDHFLSLHIKISITFYSYIS